MGKVVDLRSDLHEIQYPTARRSLKKIRKSIASPMASKDQVLKVRIRSPKSAWRRTAITMLGSMGRVLAENVIRTA